MHILHLGKGGSLRLDKFSQIESKYFDNERWNVLNIDVQTADNI